MVSAFVLINVEGKALDEIGAELLKCPGVKEVYIVAGEYDMVAVLRVRDNQQLSELITKKIVHTPGIERTKTLFALQVFSELDLDAIYGVE